MKPKVKSLITLGAMVAGIILIIVGAGCAAFGRNPSPPTKLEQKLFTIETNYIPQVVLRTNIVYETNHVVVTVTKTNDAGGTYQEPLTVLRTNDTGNIYKDPVKETVVTPHPQVTQQTNIVEAYTLTPGPGAKDIALIGKTAGGIAFPGFGEAIGTGLLGLLAFWGHFRSYKGKQAAVGLAQEVETIREFIKSLPQGANYDQAITNWLQAHQVELGIVPQVLDLLERQVSNPDARASLEAIREQLRLATTSHNP